MGKKGKKHYPSIESVFVRNRETNRLNTEEVRIPEVDCIKEWLLTEKVDGTNISVVVDDFGMVVRGRTDNAQFPSGLVDAVLDTLPTHEDILAYFGREPKPKFQFIEDGWGEYSVIAAPYLGMVFYTDKAEGDAVEDLLQQISRNDVDAPLVLSQGIEIERNVNYVPEWSVTFFGEGYGAGIQKGGGNYRPDKGFIVFDIQINGTWLSDTDMRGICTELRIPVVPLVATVTELPRNRADLLAIIPESIVAEKEGVLPEGVVAKPSRVLLDNRGDRVMWKICYREFPENAA